MSKQRNILLLGGSGFIGKQLAFALANRGWQVTVPSRRPHRHRSLLVHPGIRLLEANIIDSASLKALCADHQAMINLVGILHEKRKGDFRRFHVEFIKTVVDACSETGIKRLLHVSALGANEATGSSLYLRSKGEGENLLHTFGQRGLQVTSFQPSVVFGKGDAFINRFAGVLKLCVGYFPLACADSKLQPVYVGDLVAKIVASVDNRATYSKRYPVCGPEIFTLQQILELIIDTLKLPVRVLPLGKGLSRLQALILQNLPGKLFTMDNYRSLQTDNVCQDCELCQTSLRQYIHGLADMFGNKRTYDAFRRNYPSAERPGDDLR
ncbi:MAG: complex I NDUFA9 subunit family protein [Gammaproteobacteria bacterium]|nr:complex I NDUFA9 subunit family protein [Gammaproteobacteria bacterium]MDH3448012.1 complex I NDUFA9 subunit family protein [Gammaproteobacteria bacterium]